MLQSSNFEYRSTILYRKPFEKSTAFIFPKPVILLMFSEENYRTDGKKLPRYGVCSIGGVLFRLQFIPWGR